VKWKTMRCVGSRRNSSRVFLEASAPRFALDAQPTLDAAVACDQADHRFERWMSRLSQTMSHRVSGGGAVEQGAEKSRESPSRTGIADHAFGPHRWWTSKAAIRA